MKALLATEMETGDLADFESGAERNQMSDNKQGQHIHDAIYDLQQQVAEQGKHIEKLEAALMRCNERLEQRIVKLEHLLDRHVALLVKGVAGNTVSIEGLLEHLLE